jgi:hypothetical protein
MIVDDIRQAQFSGDKEHVLTLLHVLHHFLKTHPEAGPSDHPGVSNCDIDWCIFDVAMHGSGNGTSRT